MMNDRKKEFVKKLPRIFSFSIERNMFTALLYSSVLLSFLSFITEAPAEESSKIKVSLSEKMKQLNKEKLGNEAKGDFAQIQMELVQKKKELQSELSRASSIISSFQLTSDRQSRPEEIQAKEKRLTEELRPEIEHIQALRKAIRNLENQWKALAVEKRDLDEAQDEFDGIWHQPDTTLGQLVIDYNISDMVYVMPPEIAAMKVHLSSQLTVPKAVWTDMLELIMAQMGVGIKQVMPFVKQLYFLRVNQSGLQFITDDRLLLEAVSEESKVAFVLAPPAGDLRRVYQFIDRFSPQEQLSVQVLGGQLVVVGLVREVRELLKVYDFITSPKRAQEYRLVSLEKADSDEVAKILMSIFEGDVQKGGSEGSSFSAEKQMNFLPMMSQGDSSFGFRVIAMKYPASSLFLMGKAEQIEKACQIIRDIETNIGEVQDKTIYWYACQHSESEELAKVLSQVYVKLLSSKGALSSQRNGGEVQSSIKITNEKTRLPAAVAQQRIERAQEWNIAHPQDSLIVPSTMVSMADMKAPSTGNINDNFIVDPKTNSIIMVVENFVLGKLKELVKKLDVPKRMVQIDVLMFEKRVTDSSSFGLNLLKTGSEASGKHSDSIMWNNSGSSKKGSSKKHKKHKSSGSAPDLRGILQFAISRGKSGSLPAYDLAYQFLLSQEDIQINANPSIVTVNQTPAKIAVVDQISINTGAVEYDKEHVKDAYSRAEYGITIQITPTVHSKLDQEEELDSLKFVTLATEIIFDTTHPDKNDRPEVTRRNIKNEVRVRDGETVILGGLRKKHSTGSQQSIPFLGELPGIGKLFSTTALTDLNTEMFIFITPKIVPDNREAAYKLRYDELIRRPGDIPEFLEEIEKAKAVEKKALFERSLKLILSPPLVESQM